MHRLRGTKFLLPAVAGILLILPDSAWAQSAAKLSGGNTAWIITATALVLFMTMPGLALFYGGLVRSKNVLSVLMHCFAITAISSILWLVLAYSIAFGGDGIWWGGLSKSFLSGVGVDTLFGDIPESVFFMFQMTFAIITPGLIVGAYVERIKFSAVVIFSGLWLIIVYAPSAHWIWGGGLLANLGWAGLEGYATMDFAGGLVVHANAGVAALLIAKVLGPRRGFPSELRPPHNPGMVMIGAAMLWVGWFGFNAGSALAANGSAGMAMTVTHISAATACLVWIAIEWIKFGKPSLVGIATGAIAGLATITPGSGFVGPVGALVYGLLAGVICFFAINLIKKTLKIDDSLDVFAVHGVGGILGILLTGIFADSSFGGVGLPEGVSIGTAFLGQLIAVGVTIVWAAIAGYIIIKITQAVVGLRVNEDDESEGLDLTEHGERGYDL
ncbi:MAG: ammonium transporter [Rhodospirillaceae bacterium]|nr:ammonium transporter [Rhodospirillaceae bacterium]MBT4118192.1 ammonium transporter [Rhodospirillaceae bacterium]MBT6859816.1 ammonium transporter [Rhodospirillaceae bacterium]